MATAEYLRRFKFIFPEKEVVEMGREREEALRSRNFGNMAEYPERNLLPLVRIGNEI